MKRKDEKFCPMVFSQHLERQSSKKLEWTEVPSSEEPPDYVLDIADQTFAVEVTTLMDVDEIGGFPHSSEALNASLLRFCERLERDAIRRGILFGLYVLGLEPIANFKVREPEIRKRVFDFMCRTKELNITPCETLERDGVNRIDIQKWGNHKNYLAPVISRGEGLWDGELRATAHRMLAKALKQKRWKLRNWTAPH